jgi:predicted alpha/beta hydrolase
MPRLGGVRARSLQPDAAGQKFRRSVHAMAGRAFGIGLDALVAGHRVASQAIFGSGHRDAITAAFGKVPGFSGVAGQAVAVIDVELVALVGHMAGFAGRVADRDRLLCQGRFRAQAQRCPGNQ